VDKLIRKLKETLQNNELLIIENNKLKQELESFEEIKRVERNDELSDTSSNKTEEKYQKIKSEMQLYIEEIDECIQMIEK